MKIDDNTMYLIKMSFQIGGSDEVAYYATAVTMRRFWVYCSTEKLVYSVDVDDDLTVNAGYTKTDIARIIENGEDVLEHEWMGCEDTEDDNADVNDMIKRLKRFAEYHMDGYSMRDLNPEMFDKEDGCDDDEDCCSDASGFGFDFDFES